MYTKTNTEFFTSSGRGHINSSAYNKSNTSKSHTESNV